MHVLQNCTCIHSCVWSTLHSTVTFFGTVQYSMTGRNNDRAKRNEYIFRTYVLCPNFSHIVNWLIAD